MSFFSAYEPLILPGSLSFSELKRVSKPWSEPISRLRVELGLPPGQNPLFEEYLSTDAVLALFSPLVGNRQPDWPPETVVTGFVTYDHFSTSGPALAKLREFLVAGPPPIVFTLSSDAVNAPTDNFYAESLLAVQMLGCRAVLLGLNLPEARSGNVLTLSHAPFSEVFPHAAAIVHNGGVGTLAIALRAGRPMLAVPGSFAQPDMAARLIRLGVARAIPRAYYRAATAARELRVLLSNPNYAINAATVAQRVAKEEGARCACDVIEGVMNESTKSEIINTPQHAGQHTVISNSTSPQAVEAGAYLHLLKKTLTRFPLDPYEQLMIFALGKMDPALIGQIALWVVASQSVISRNFGFNPILRSLGMDWPAGETMIGLYRLNNLEQCILSVLSRGVPGDLAETGVWRGGASIFMRAVLNAYGDVDRKVWLADSFQGLPKPDAESYPADVDDELWAFSQLAVSLETVKANFARYGLLDEQVRFLPGWFRDTLPAAPIDRLAVLRLDGDLYESTIVALRSLYPKLSPGGFVIVDDYSYLPCRQAVEDFRAEEGIIEPLCPIDWTGVYWQARALPKAEPKR